MQQIIRPWLVRWLLIIAFLHLVAGFVATWGAELAVFGDYHRSVMLGFWSAEPPVEALKLHIWWVNLFGATLQNFAIFMGILIFVGNKIRAPWVWGWMMLGVALWAIQDIAISVRASVWSHIWADTIALMMLIPPLALLWRFDKI